MSTSATEEDWWSVRTGEYVLGTLRGEDLALFERMLAHDTDLQKRVAHWEQRLSGLNETTRAKEPGEHVWPQVLQRVQQLNSGTVNKQSADSSGGEDFWRTVAGLAVAACLLLTSIQLYQITQPAPPPFSIDGLAVVLSDENDTPYFLVETDYDSSRVRITVLSPPDLDDEQAFQLWQAVPDRSSVEPIALLPEDAGASRILDVDSLVDGSDLFGVSIESDGAETDSGPIGPVVAHGDFRSW